MSKVAHVLFCWDHLFSEDGGSVEAVSLEAHSLADYARTRYELTEEQADSLLRTGYLKVNPRISLAIEFFLLV